MSHYRIYEWHKIADAPRRCKCQHLGCKRKARKVLYWATLDMAAPAFWYYCAEHGAEQVTHA